MWCEKVTEGDRNARMKLDKAPMSANKFLRKTAKHILWISIGFATGFTFVGYFTPIRELPMDLITGAADGWAYFLAGLFHPAHLFERRLVTRASVHSHVPLLTFSERDV